jgi:hypothetical protein
MGSDVSRYNLNSAAGVSLCLSLYLRAFTDSYSGSNGANLSFPDALGIPVDDPVNGVPNPNAARNQWYQGLVNAGPYIASALL